MGVKKVIVNGETIIDLSNTTLEAEEALAGEIFYTSDGAEAVGSGKVFSDEFDIINREVQSDELPGANEDPITIVADKNKAFGSVTIPPKDGYIKPEGAIKLSENGENINIKDYATANVSVKPNLLEATDKGEISKNGEVTYKIADEGKDPNGKWYDGYSSISFNVKVPLPTRETLTIDNVSKLDETYGEEGSDLVYEKVVVSSKEDLGLRDRPSKTWRQYTENEKDITDHLDYEKIDINVPNGGDINLKELELGEIATNDSYAYNIASDTEGYHGYKSITFDVNVKPNLLSTNKGKIQKNGEVTYTIAEEGVDPNGRQYDGYSSISFEVDVNSEKHTESTLTINSREQFDKTFPDTPPEEGGRPIAYTEVKLDSLENIVKLTEKTVTPSSVPQECVPNENDGNEYYGLSKVIINPVPATGITCERNGAYYPVKNEFINEVIVAVPPKPEKISSDSEMENLLADENNIGNIYKYTGETTDSFVKDELYMVVIDE